MQPSPLIEANCKAVEDFKLGLITEPEMWSIIRSNIKIDVEYDDEPHRAARGENVYNVNRRGRYQPNGYIKEIEEYGPYGSVIVSFWDEPEETEVLISMLEMNWDAQYKRWYVTPKRKSTFFRDKLAAYKANKGNTNERQD